MLTAQPVSDAAKVESTIAEVVKDFGRLDVFIANAGTGISKPILEQTLEEYRSLMAVNGMTHESRCLHLTGC